MSLFLFSNYSNSNITTNEQSVLRKAIENNSFHGVSGPDWRRIKDEENVYMKCIYHYTTPAVQQNRSLSLHVTHIEHNRSLIILE